MVLARMTVGWPVCSIGGLVRGVDLAVVVAAALEPPDVVVGHVRDHRAGARVAAEEVLADEGAVLGAVGLVVAVRRDVHQVDQRVVAVRGEQRVPLAAPDHLDDVPAGAAEERLELLDDLAVAAHRAVEPLQVAVDDEGEVVELLAGGELQRRRGDSGSSISPSPRNAQTCCSEVSLMPRACRYLLNCAW